MRDAGLSVREDAVGNTFARWDGADPTLPAVATGSHIDAIPNAGRFDGTVGVLGGLEAIRALQRAGFRPRRSIELMIFTSEEPTRFGIGCLGSRLLAGALDARRRRTPARSRQARRWTTSRAAAGFTGPLESRPPRADDYAAFVELHIEQGPLLERHGHDIGIVTAIAAPASLRVCIEGEGGHAGAVLMPRSARRVSGRRGNRAGRGGRRAGDRRHRHGGHRRRVRGVSGRRQQRAEPCAPRDRRPRHRRVAPRLSARTSIGGCGRDRGAARGHGQERTN